MIFNQKIGNILKKNMGKHYNIYTHRGKSCCNHQGHSLIPFRGGCCKDFLKKVNMLSS